MASREEATFYRVLLADVNLSVRRYGSGPIHIFATHGLSGFSYDWKQLATQHMSPEFSLWALDMRGFGDSGWTAKNGYSAARMATDIVEVAEALGLAHVHVVGHSFGGRAALLACGQKPALFRSLTLVDAGPVPGPGGARVKERIGTWPEEFAELEEMMARYRKLYSAETPAFYADRMRQYTMQLPGSRVRIRRDPWWKEIWAKASPPTNTDPWLSWVQLATPTLLVRGGNSDMLSQDVAEQMRNSADVASYAEIAGVGHNIPLVAAKELWTAMQPFYSSLEPLARV